jgi:nucleoside-diphosphate-sugar epimerase
MQAFLEHPDRFGLRLGQQMHALILGGTGSAGRALVAQLRAGGPNVELTVVSRTATHVAGADRVLSGHYGELAGSSDFRRRLQGMDVIVHLADGLSALQNRRAAGAAEAEQLLAASVRLTVAARQAKVPLFVYVSSIKALCDEHDDRVLAETDESRASSLYGRSKWQLEQSLAALLNGSDTRLAIVRNPVMYGGDKSGSVQRLLQLADTALPLPLDDLGNRRSLLAVRNFAGALAAIVRSGPAAPGGIFHVHDGPALSTTEIVAILRAALGRPRRLFPVGAAATAVTTRAPLIGAAARRLYGSLELSDARFRRAFQWTPSIDTRAALAEVARAFSTGSRIHDIRAAAPSRT